MARKPILKKTINLWNLLLLPPSAFFLIGIFIWVLRSFHKEQVEEPDFKLAKHKPVGEST